MTDTITPEKLEAAQRGVELLTRDRDCMVECNSNIERVGDEFKPVPGTLDPDCEDDLRDYNAAIEAIPALLSALATERDRADKAGEEIKRLMMRDDPVFTYSFMMRAHKAEAELSTLRARVEELESAAWQVLDDMGADGLSVCAATKHFLQCKYLGKPYRESEIGKFSGREIHIDNDFLNEKEPEHVLYETGDADAPNAIKDRNGDVVLALCRNCDKSEIDLHGPCRNQKESSNDAG